MQQLFAAVNAFDSFSTLRVILDGIFGKVTPLVLYIDSKSLYDSIVELGATNEKRLLIDLPILKEPYELRKLSEMAWIPSAQNPVDAMIKINASNELETLMKYNKIYLDKESWVERPGFQLDAVSETTKKCFIR